MTYWGTNTYVVGEGRVAVIDPGPADPAHLQAILDGLSKGEEVSHILVTHAHLDHSPLARPLSEATGAPVLAYGDALAGRSDVMAALVADGLTSGGEGVDAGFTPDETLTDGDMIQGDGWQLEALWTPGHFANHLCFALGDAVFTADHVMGWASSLVSPPDGDLTAFMASCRTLAARSGPRLLPRPWRPSHRSRRAYRLADHPPAGTRSANPGRAESRPRHRRQPDPGNLHRHPRRPDPRRQAQCFRPSDRPHHPRPNLRETNPVRGRTFFSHLSEKSSKNLWTPPTGSAISPSTVPA